MVIEIENKYPELIQSQDSHGQTWVHYAAGMDNMILKVLLKHKSCTAAYIRDNEGRTPAHNIAAQHNYVDGLKSIMEYFPDSCEIVDKKGRNIVHYAAFLGQIETLDYFLMDSRFINLLNKTEDDGNTPLHLLASSLTDLPIASLYKMQLLIPKLRELQLKTYNQSKLTPGDIANAIKISDLELAYQDVVNDFIKVAPKGGMIKHWFSPLESHKCDIEAQKKDIASNLLRTTKTHMVVATISFAAGLSVPGGFNQNDKDDVNRGAAMLGNKTAFRVFMISDSIALASALIAILCYLWIAFGKGKGCSTQLFIGAFQVITISIFALMIAFMAGTYAILQQSTEVIAFFVLLIFSTFTYIYILFAMTVTKFSFARKNLMKNRFRKSPKKWKEEVLHGQINTLAEYFFKRLQNRS